MVMELLSLHASVEPRPVHRLARAALTASPPTRAADDGVETRTLHGLYTSGFADGPQRIRVEFTRQPEGSEMDWKVAFHFRWAGENRVYRGVASGSLTEGRLFGQVHDEDRARLFNFRCEFDKKKRCKGKHAEVVRTGEHETGTITLKGRA